MGCFVCAIVKSGIEWEGIMNKRTIYQAFSLTVVMALIMVQLGMAGDGNPPVPTNIPTNRLERGMTSWEGESVPDNSKQSTQAQSPAVTNILNPWDKIVFESYRDNNYEIYLIDGSTGNQI
jgi:hypothetical protein